MHANAAELPLRGNYFAESEYIDQDLASGRLTNRAGARIFALPDDLMVSLSNVLADGLGDRAPGVMKSVGRGWGSRAAEQFAVELGAHHAVPLASQPLSLFAADLTSALRHHGWGSCQFDFSRYSIGLLVVEVDDPFLGSAIKATHQPVEGVFAGFLAGMFSHFAGIELDCLQTECRAAGGTRSRFVLTVPARLQAVAELVGSGHDAILAALEKSSG